MKQQAVKLDSEDSLKEFRKQFLFSQSVPNHDDIYLCGNSLGLQPKKTQEYINQELSDWAKLGVEGHFEAKHPWLPYHEFVTASLARLVGANESEVVAMNSLTVNLHLLMVTFYRPTKSRYKILVEHSPFPSDMYLVKSQARFHAQTIGFDLEQAIIEMKPREGELHLRTEDIIKTIEENKESLAVVLIGGVNYLSGQVFDIPTLAKKAHAVGAKFGVDLAHAAGNIELKLHDWQVDFAAWCSYKYLNSGPGGIAGAFVHEKFHKDASLPRFEGWWGQNKQTRFLMQPNFDPIPTVEAWQLSNPPIFQLAALRASLEIFDQAQMPRIRKKSKDLTAYLLQLIDALPSGFVDVLTPKNPEERGSQLSLKIKNGNKQMVETLRKEGIICDFRSPNVIRVAPTALYNSFMDCYTFIERLGKYAK